MKIDFNAPETWVNAAIHEPPSSVDVAGYQAKIDRICGFNPSGKSNIILTWCPSMENYSREYCEWNAAGFGTKTHLRGLYKFVTLYDDAGNPVDVPPPRWALKQWQSAVQYIGTDEQTRWTTLTVGKQKLVREKRPPRSSSGRYIPFMRIGKHSETCCIEAKRNEAVCYGKYRAPDDAYLELLRKAVKLRSEEKNGQDPEKPLSNATLMQAAKETAELELRQKREAEEMEEQFFNEHSGIQTNKERNYYSEIKYGFFTRRNRTRICAAAGHHGFYGCGCRKRNHDRAGQ